MERFIIVSNEQLDLSVKTHKLRFLLWLAELIAVAGLVQTAALLKMLCQALADVLKLRCTKDTQE